VSLWSRQNVGRKALIFGWPSYPMRKNDVGGKFSFRVTYYKDGVATAKSSRYSHARTGEILTIVYVGPVEDFPSILQKMFSK
jgi:hypothetical protein